MALDLTRERHGEVLVLTPAGRLDNDSAAELELAAQEELADGTRHLVLDLAQLGYISNAGLRVLSGLAKALPAPSGSLRLAALPPALKQVFDAAGFTPVFSFYPSLDAALASHPAAAGSAELAALARQLLGLGAPSAAADTATPDGLAKLALELLGRPPAPTPARALAGGTQFVPRVQVAAPAPARQSWWQRLLGTRKR